VLDAPARERIGLRVEPLATAEALPEHRAYGYVVDPTPLAESVAALSAARASAATASAEAGRQRMLHANGRNVSDRGLETAEANAASAAAAATAASAQLLGSWGPAIGERPDLDAFVAALVRGERRLLRLDLPAGESVTGRPQRARIESLVSSEPAVDDHAKPNLADLVGPTATVDAGTQGTGFYFVVDAPPPDLAPGRAITGYLPTGSTALTGVAVPRTAIVRFDGHAWMWLEGKGDALMRTQVELAQPISDGWLVADPSLTGRRIVVSAAQELLSEDLRDQLGGDEE
jgi:hypothetical protein